MEQTSLQDLQDSMRFIEAKRFITGYVKEHTFGVRNDGSGYEVGPFTKAFVSRFHPEFNVDAKLDEWNCQAFEGAVQTANANLKLHYTLLFGETLTENVDLDVQRIFSATERTDYVTSAVSRISAAYVLTYMRDNPKVSNEEAILTGHLFAAFLREEIQSGSNRDYEPLPLPPGITGHTDWWPEFSKMRLFVKAAFIAERGMELYKFNRWYRPSRTMRAPRLVMRWVERR